MRATSLPFKLSVCIAYMLCKYALSGSTKVALWALVRVQINHRPGCFTVVDEMVLLKGGSCTKRAGAHRTDVRRVARNTLMDKKMTAEMERILSSILAVRTAQRFLSCMVDRPVPSSVEIIFAPPRAVAAGEGSLGHDTILQQMPRDLLSNLRASRPSRRQVGLKDDFFRLRVIIQCRPFLCGRLFEFFCRRAEPRFSRPRR